MALVRSPVLSVPSHTDIPAAASEANANPPVAPVRPGILIVTLHEGKGFSLPPEYEQRPSSSQPSNSLAGGGGFSVSGSLRNAPSASQQQGVSSSIPNTTTLPSSGGINAVPLNHGRYPSKYLPYALLDFDKLQVFVNAVSGSPENPLWAGDNTAYKFDVSRVTELSVQIYLRNPNAAPGSGRNEDIFLGVCRVTPRFEEARQYVEDPKSSKKDKEKAAAAFAEQERSRGQIGSQWLDVTYGTGQLKIGVEYVESRAHALKIEDFELLKVVGKGSFGKVMQVMYVCRAPPLPSAALID